MRRRNFILSVGSFTLLPATTWAQQLARTARIGRLSPLSEPSERPMLDGLRRGLAELGWVEGRNIAYELRVANGQIQKLPALAAELVAERVDVIVTGSNPGALAAKSATRDIPVVFVTTGDPVAAGIVQSLGRPGGNLTGITLLGGELNAKRVELLKDMSGGLKDIAVLVNPGSPYTSEFNENRDRVARAFGVELHLAEARDASDIPGAFDRIKAVRAGALLVLADIIFVTHRQQIIDTAAAIGVPAMYPDRSFVETGGLLFYGAALPDMYRHAAIYVDKILKGARPADLPVEQPTTFQLVVNLKTAKAMGLKIRESFLARADQVIE
ncbi:MAG: ABC transporter substrate-binding protein [Pseudorhodoplanes sp.]|uniref:ABC transporter substrate-binding protein n=1 Tax=Pseudorhodoplanes sp. TaxID=1934341 RepID=UPI003D099363